MTTIHFERAGGFQGDPIQLDLDLSRLPDNESQLLQRLIRDADFYSIPERSPGNPSPDEYEYVITVRAGQSQHTVRTSDTTMPKALSPLVEELSGINAARLNK